MGIAVSNKKCTKTVIIISPTMIFQLWLSSRWARVSSKRGMKECSTKLWTWGAWVMLIKALILCLTSPPSIRLCVLKIHWWMLPKWLIACIGFSRHRATIWLSPIVKSDRNISDEVTLISQYSENSSKDWTKRAMKWWITFIFARS